MRTFALAVVTLGLLAGRGHAETLTGTVFLDRDGDGLFGANDTPLAGVTVAWERSQFTTTAADGTYSLVVPAAIPGIVWASVPESGRPGPAWVAIDEVGGPTTDIAIAPAVASSSTFVVAADTHMDGVTGLWTAADLALALDEAVATVAPPAFVTVVGDVTQANQPADFAAVAVALDGITAPWVPVPGNHDWYDGGASYRRTYGPDCYSFSIPGAHFVVWNSNLTAQQVRDFIAADLANVDHSHVVVIALGHAPPTDDVAAAMAESGVDYLFSGHWHVNRMIARGGLVELGTEPLVMGGIDLMPAGYRVVTLDRGTLAVDHHTFVDEPQLAIAWPPAETCIDRDPQLLVSAEVGSGLREVHATIDGTDYKLARVGGWAWRLPAIVAGPGPHQMSAAAIGPDGEIGHVLRRFSVCDDPSALVHVARGGEWRQVQGGAEHRGAGPDELGTPLRPGWAAAIGGTSHEATPVSDGVRVYTTVVDLAAGTTGGVVALDLASGVERWRVVTPVPVRGAPAVEAGLVVFGQTDGTVRAVDAETGESRWSVDLHDGIDSTVSSLWAAPTIYDGSVYIGTDRELAAITLATGAVQWTVDPYPEATWLATFSSIGVSGDVVIGTFERAAGLIAYSRATGAELWRLDYNDALAVHASIVIADGIAYVGDGRGEVIAVDVASGVVVWRTKLIDSDPEWGYTIAGTPAYADGRLFVAMQWDRMVALDATTGTELWHATALPGSLRTAHYRGIQSGYQASPVVAGATVWFADTSGELIGADVATGETRWATRLSAATLSGMAISGETLLVPTFDGVLHALVGSPPHPVPVLPVPSAPGGGCGATRGGGGELALVGLVTALLVRRRRRRPATAREARARDLSSRIGRRR